MLRDMNGMRDKGGRTMSEMRELIKAVNEVAILKKKKSLENNAK